MSENQATRSAFGGIAAVLLLLASMATLSRHMGHDPLRGGDALDGSRTRFWYYDLDQHRLFTLQARSKSPIRVPAEAGDGTAYQATVYVCNNPDRFRRFIMINRWEQLPDGEFGAVTIQSRWQDGTVWSDDPARLVWDRQGECSEPLELLMPTR